MKGQRSLSYITDSKLAQRVNEFDLARIYMMEVCLALLEGEDYRPLHHEMKLCKHTFGDCNKRLENWY